MTRPVRTLLLVEDSPEDRGAYRAFLAEDREFDCAGATPTSACGRCSTASSRRPSARTG
jgi:hypothetical protein